MNQSTSHPNPVQKGHGAEDIPPKQANKKRGIVELFAGIGGVAQGFAEQGGYEIIALTDIDIDARDTFLENFPDFPKSKYLVKDVRDLTARDLLDAAEGRAIEGLLGCPPCQGFSAAGKRNPKDERNRLMRDYMRLVKDLRPKFFVLENVPGILQNAEFQKSLSLLTKEFGYEVWAGALNAALYGAPQTRQRAIAIGFDQSLGVRPAPPVPTHLGYRRVFDYATQKFVTPNEPDGWRTLGIYAELRHNGGLKDWLSQLDGPDKFGLDSPPLTVVQEAIGDLPPLEAGERCAQSDVYNHEAWSHDPEFVKRLTAIPEGGNAEGSGRCRRYFSQAYGRLHRQGLARTITANFHNPGSGRFTHYRDHRAITVREAARLQGFNDDFVFIKTRKVQERLIGNAFHKGLARVIANHIDRLLSAC